MLAVAAAVSAAPVIGCSEDRPVRAACDSFDAARWRSLQNDRSDDREADRERLELGRQVVRCRLLDGRTTEEVTRLLGPPSDAERDSWEYYLAPEPGPAPLDQIWLFLDIDDGRVGRYEVGPG